MMRALLAVLALASMGLLPASAAATSGPVAAGGNFVCALFEAGEVKCWGANGSGQLGIGSFDDQIGDGSNEMGNNLQAVMLGSGAVAVKIAAGSEHACAILDSGKIKCWGFNSYGQLGLGEDTQSRGTTAGDMGDNLPIVDLGNDYEAVEIACGMWHTCAIFIDGRLKCWGSNGYGQLGLGEFSGSRGREGGEMGDDLTNVKVSINDLEAFSIALGGDHTCAIAVSGDLFCWGMGYHGQLGLSTMDTIGQTTAEMANLQPVDLGIGRSAIGISLGNFHTCGLLNIGAIACFGDQEYGQLGTGSTTERVGDQLGEMGNNLTTVNLGSGRSAVQVAAGQGHTCAVLDNGDVKCWGRNNDGQLGLGDAAYRGDEPNEMGDNLTAVDLGPGRTAVWIDLGEVYTCALLADGSLKCWGSNYYGQLGQGNTGPRGGDDDVMGDTLLSIDFGTSSITHFCQLGEYGTFGNCSTCPAGSWAPVGITTEDECLACEAGKFSVEGAAGCFDCPAGTSSNVTGADDISTCDPCVAGSYADETGSTECTLCPPGTWYDTSGATTALSCMLCAAGKYSEVQGANSSDTCRDCSAGKYSVSEGAGNETLCQLCPRGTYSEAQGATNVTTCEPCVAGKYSDVEGAAVCISCAAGKYSTEPGADNEEYCELCDAGRYSTVLGATSKQVCTLCGRGTYSAQPGSDHCEACDKGEGPNSGHTECLKCEEGEYSDSGVCLSCPSGLTSAASSESADACQSPVSSFVAGAVFLLVALVILCVYVFFGRAMRVAFLEQQTSTPMLVQACTSATAAILTRMQRQRSTGLIWQLFLLLVTLIAVFVGTVMWFLTNTFLLSTSFLSPPDWLDQFDNALAKLVDSFPLLWFLVIVPPIMRWVRAIDFTVLMVGVQVTCQGAQAPVLLMMTGVIVVATILVIGSQFHAMAALAFVPMASLVQMELLAARAPTLLLKINHMLKFVLLTGVSAFVMSCSRYVMQVFATLVEYDAFLPKVEPSDACDDQGIDSLLATASTVVFYVCVGPVLLLMVRVLTPGLPPALRFPVPAKSVSLGRYRRVKSALNQLNPLKWMMSGLYRLVLKLVAISSAQGVQENLSPSLKASVQTVDRAELQRSWHELKARELPTLFQLLGMLRHAQSIAEVGRILWLVVQACAWKLKLALLVVVGVWTDEMAPQIEETTHQYYSWTRDPKLLHEDVVTVIGTMRSMVWMLAPPLIILTKLAEVTNNPPVFVLTDKLHMTSPLLFGSWAEAEAVMEDGLQLLEKMEVTNKKSAKNDAPAWQPKLLHNLRVALVWVLGARVPRYAVQVSLLGLVVAMVLRPHMAILLAAMTLILLWSFLLASATVLDVRVILRLRKQQPCVEAMTAMANVAEVAEVAEVVETAEIEMTSVADLQSKRADVA